MSGVYIGVDGKARKVKGAYIGIDGKARKIKKGYIGDENGVARLCWVESGKKLSEYPVGSTVYLNENGSPVEYLVVNKGLPSDMYDSSCDGVWLLRKDVYEIRVWDEGEKPYQNSNIHTYLNTDIFNLFDDNLKRVIKRVKIPYWNGLAKNGSLVSGANGLSTSVFLLSTYEVGWETINNSYFTTDGTCLEYFTGTTTIDGKRIAYLNGVVARWWLRSPYIGASATIQSVTANGNYEAVRPNLSAGVRPTLILPSDTLFDEETNTFKG